MTEETAETAAVQEEVKIENPEAVLNALDRAKSDAKKFREEKEQLEIDLNSKSQMIAEYSAKLLREKVKAKFAENGIKDAGRLFKFIDFNSLEFDDNFDVVGFDEQFTKMQEDFPEIFDPKLRVGGQADGAVATSINTKISASELQARQVLGKI